MSNGSNRGQVPPISSLSFREQTCRGKRAAGRNDRKSPGFNVVKAFSANLTGQIASLKGGKNSLNKTSVFTSDTTQDDHHKLYRCEEKNCNKKFFSETDLKIHHQKTHGPINEQICGVCFAKFAFLADLEKHVCLFHTFYKPHNLSVQVYLLIEKLHILQVSCLMASLTSYYTLV